MAGPRSNRKTPAAVAVTEVGNAELSAIVAATIAGSFVFTLPEIHNPLIEAGLVEINTEITNEAGQIATRATEKGKGTVSMENTATTEVTPATDTAVATETTTGTAPAKVKPVFTLVAAVEIPKITRNTDHLKGRESIYPFDTMEVGHSFFVAATEAKPEPAKSLASTVTSANNRFAVEKKDEAGNTIMRKNRKGNMVADTELTRKFDIRVVEDGAPWGFPGVKGAGIWRTK